MSELELFGRFPQTRTLARVELGQFPTPVAPLERLGSEFGIPNLFVKRDDLSGTLYGGNKVRKLEFLLGDAKAQGYDKVWTVGAIGSHHVLATSIYAREIGLQPAALHFPQPITAHVLDVLKALSTTQPELTLVGHMAQVPMAMAKIRIKEWLARHPDVYYIPGGGSSLVGVLGYVNAALELKHQVDQGELPEPDVIFVGAGTCGTLSGLILGCHLAGMKSRVIGVRVVDKVIANAHTAATLANRCGHVLEQLGVKDIPKIRRQDVTILDNYIGPGYGEPTAEGARYERLVMDLEDLELDPTYTAKAFAAIIGERARLDLAHKSVLYWHTLSSADLNDRVRGAQVEWDLPPEYQHFF
ncbi:MAG: pyridoxal-phosphate dependent enzyme [Bradymonadaceae bacterium]|nr:pyridoxal-phosphate dependent enzyme [Lujinxingiaceae bacterium]